MTENKAELTVAEPSQESALVSRADLEAVLGGVLRKFAAEVKESFAYHGRRMDEMAGLNREVAQETRGALEELAKLRQLQRVEGQLAYLEGVHGAARAKELLNADIEAAAQRVVEARERQAKRGDAGQAVVNGETT